MRNKCPANVDIQHIQRAIEQKHRLESSATIDQAESKLPEKS
jgi:hypothetical protein